MDPEVPLLDLKCQQNSIRGIVDDTKTGLMHNARPCSQHSKEAMLLQGVMGRMASWFGASTSGRNGSAHSRAQHSSSSGVPDFLAQADDPDKRRIDLARAQNRGDP